MSSKTKLPDFAPAIARFREIADTSTYALLTEGPVHPDHKLLELCADALHYFKQSERALAARQFTNWVVETDPAKREAGLEEDRRLLAEHNAAAARGKPYLPNIRKLRAQTAAGIYAKAAVVKASRTGAADLARSLAEDLLAVPGLREVLWPAQKGDAA